MTNSNSHKGFAPVKVIKKIGSEHLHHSGQPINATLLDFWSWSTSDLVSNIIRGVLAEYIVVKALGLADGVRDPWQPYDLQTPTGTKIEVKSAAYMQSWQHDKLSTIVFDVSPTREWNPITNKQAKETKRQADIYVFCLLAHQEKETLDPLNLDQWEFYILGADVLNKHYPQLESISLKKLQVLNPHKVKFAEIASHVAELSQAINTLRTA